MNSTPFLKKVNNVVINIDNFIITTIKSHCQGILTFYFDTLYFLNGFKISIRTEYAEISDIETL
jgi:hypothetical protein